MELREKLKEVQRKIAELQKEEVTLERIITGGSNWGGSFAEVFGCDDGPAEWDGYAIVREGVYQRVRERQIIVGGIWASSFGGPAHSMFKPGQGPVLMRSDLSILPFYSGYGCYKLLMRLARKNNVSITCLDDINCALDWADRMARKEKFRSRHLSPHFKFVIEKHMLEYPGKLAALMINGKLINIQSIAQGIKDSHGDPAERHRTVANKLFARAKVELRRRVHGRHQWADALVRRAELIRQRSWEIEASQACLERASEIFQALIRTGVVDRKLRKILSNTQKRLAA